MSKRRLIVAYFLLLFVLHQDFWLRDDPGLVFGLLPASLAYHVVWTLLVAAGWFLVTKHAWPDAFDRDVARAATPPEDSTR